MSKPVKIFTIGFTRKSARQFFEKLAEAGVKKLIDVRLYNVSQLAGFAKKDDLEFFLAKLSKITYTHEPELAPSAEMLKEYRKSENWERYEKKFLKLMKKRRIEELFKPDELHRTCLLCSEPRPHHCHRRLVAEYLQSKWKNVEIVHLE